MAISHEEAKQITTLTDDLSIMYPVEAAYSSRCTLWTKGYKDGKVNDEQFALARIYYGRMWNYVGD